MIVGLLGSLGNMGRRYASICKHLEHEVIGLDKVYSGAELENLLDNSDAIIIATPTTRHALVISELCQYPEKLSGIDILCEKPVTTDIVEAKMLFNMVKQCDSELMCVNQYAHLPEAREFLGAKGTTHYNYYKSGEDGLSWDCFQLYAVASDRVVLKNNSPIWSCSINDVEVDISNMDRAYVAMIEDFLGQQTKVWGEGVVIPTMQKILNGTVSCDRNPS